MKLLIVYNNEKIITVGEAPEGGVIASGNLTLTASKEDALQMFIALGYDVTKIEDYQPINTI